MNCLIGHLSFLVVFAVQVDWDGDVIRCTCCDQDTVESFFKNQVSVGGIPSQTTSSLENLLSILCSE